MKLKCLPKDFQVEEIVTFPVAKKGGYAVYLVRKENLTTFSLLQRMGKWIGKSVRLFSYAGLKDRHARTTQYITLKGDGPERIDTRSFTATRIGYGTEPLKSRHLLANRFTLILRDLSPEEVKTIRDNLPDVIRYGFPNYFDNQRFRSQRMPDRAFGFFIFRKDYEEALKIFVQQVCPYCKKIHRSLAERISHQWGEWQAIGENPLPSYLREPFFYLARHPNDFQGAVYRIPRNDFRMMISAAQSYLWNEVISYFLRSRSPSRLLPYRGSWQTYFFYRRLPDSLFASFQDLFIEMPHAGWRCERWEVKNILQNILTRHKLQLSDIQLPGVQGIFPENHARRVLAIPQNLEIGSPAEDEMYPGKVKITLSFLLPPGSYGTMLIKRLLLSTGA